jgi:hypothetical protein
LRSFIAAGTRVSMRNTPIFSSGFRPSPGCMRISCDCTATRSTFCERKRICLGSRGGSPTIQSVWPGCSACVTCHIPGPAYSPVTMISWSGSSGVSAWQTGRFSPHASASTVVRVFCIRPRWRRGVENSSGTKPKTSNHIGRNEETSRLRRCRWARLVLASGSRRRNA